MNRRLDAVIFDLDGVIADTVPLYYIATKKITDELVVPFTKEDNLVYQGIPRMVLIEDLVKKSGTEFTNEEKIGLGEKKNEYYQELISDIGPDQMLPGIRDFLFELKEKGIKIALASSSSNAPFVLEKLDIIHLFDAIIDPHSLAKGKPDPEIFIRAADRVGAKHENCVVIEDGEAGLSGIWKTSMFSIGVGTESYHYHADWQVASTKELNVKDLISHFQQKE